MMWKKLAGLVLVIGIAVPSVAQEEDNNDQTKANKQSGSATESTGAATIGETARQTNSETGSEDAAIKLESVFVGDKEQPAVSYFIPWQGVGAPDKLYWNVEQKHDQALDLVDREVMLRSIEFYTEMDLEAPQ